MVAVTSSHDGVAAVREAKVEERVVVRSVSMYPRDWELAEKMADEFGSNVSHVIRYAVRELSGMRALKKFEPEVEPDRVLLS